jgi:hypothetical protein
MSLSYCVLNLLDSNQNIDLSLDGFQSSGKVFIAFLNRLDSSQDSLQQFGLISGRRSFSRSHYR